MPTENLPPKHPFDVFYDMCEGAMKLAPGEGDTPEVVTMSKTFDRIEEYLRGLIEACATEQLEQLVPHMKSSTAEETAKWARSGQVPRWAMPVAK